MGLLNVILQISGGVKYGQGLQVLFKPVSGLLNQNKMLPLWYAPITIELELVDNKEDPILINLDTYIESDTITAANISLLWNISNVQVKVDMCSLDNALDNSYVQHEVCHKALGY